MLTQVSHVANRQPSGLVCANSLFWGTRIRGNREMSDTRDKWFSQIQASARLLLKVTLSMHLYIGLALPRLIPNYFRATSATNRPLKAKDLF